MAHPRVNDRLFDDPIFRVPGFENPLDWAREDNGVSRLVTQLETSPGMSRPRPVEMSQSAIIVAVHGGCEDNGNISSKATYGVYFAEDSPYNQCGFLPEIERHTCSAAQLYATKRALEIAEDVVAKEMNVEHLIIKTHSIYVAEGLSKHVWEWERNGYQTSRGNPVANRLMIEKLQDMMKESEREKGFKVSFWHVGKQHNKEAILLANKLEAFTKPEREARESGLPQNTSDRKLHYNSKWARLDPLAQQLCRRIGIVLWHHSTNIKSVLRRLVITGEDRPQNFERLFGPKWKNLVIDDWAQIRSEIIIQPELKSSMDEGAPVIRPRLPTAIERKMITLTALFNRDGTLENLFRVGHLCKCDSTAFSPR